MLGHGQCELFDLVLEGSDSHALAARALGGHSKPGYTVLSSCGAEEASRDRLSYGGCSSWCAENSYECCTYRYSGSDDGRCSGSKSVARPFRRYRIDVIGHSYIGP